MEIQEFKANSPKARGKSYFKEDLYTNHYTDEDDHTYYPPTQQQIEQLTRYFEQEDINKHNTEQTIKLDSQVYDYPFNTKFPIIDYLNEIIDCNVDSSISKLQIICAYKFVDENYIDGISLTLECNEQEIDIIIGEDGIITIMDGSTEFDESEINEVTDYLITRFEPYNFN